MKVLLVTGSFPDLRCGVGDYAARLACELASRGLEIEVLTSRSPLVRAGRAPGLGEVTVRAVTRTWSALALLRLAREVRRARPDTVLLQYPTRGYGWGLAPVLLPRALPRRLPVVTTLHEYSIAHPLRRAAGRILASASRIVLVSTARERRALLHDRPALEKFVHVVPVGPAIEPVKRVAGRQAAREFGIPDTDRLIVHFGTASRNKGIDAMARAVLLLLERGVPVHLLWVGDLDVGSASRAGSGSDSLRALLDRGALTITGHLEPAQVSQLLWAGEVGLFPFDDGVSLRRTSFLSAARHGLALVTTRGAAVPADLVDGENVLLAEPGDATALAQLVRRVLESDTLRARLARASRRWSAAYQWNRVADGTIHALETAAGLAADASTLERAPRRGA